MMAVALGMGMLMTSCASMHARVKPKAAAPSGFLKHSKDMKADPGHSPFLLNWTPAKARAKAKNKLYIAPVSLAWLRPMSKNLANLEISEKKWQEGSQVLASYAHEQFVAAFRNASPRRYEVVESPGKDTQTLELALIDLNPNTWSGSIVRNGVNAIAVPGTDLIFARAARPLKGNLVIEGRLLDSKSKETLFEFADNEESKSAVIINVRDFTTFGQARLAIREWAAQLAQLLGSAPDAEIKDASPVTFRLW